MATESNRGAFGVVLAVAVVSALLVSTSVVLLRPIQLRNAMLERSRNVMQLTGLLDQHPARNDDELLNLFRHVDARVADIDAGAFDADLDPYTFDQRRAAASEDGSVAIPPELDLANLGRRSRHATVYLVWNGDQLDRIILPVRGSGMWAMIYGFVALAGDFHTIAGASFYEQAETPGLGDRITESEWLARWQGKQAFDRDGKLVFTIGPGQVDPRATAARYHVDALTGATVTGDAVTALVRYWLGPHGFQPLLRNLAAQPPAPPDRQGESL